MIPVYKFYLYLEKSLVSCEQSNAKSSKLKTLFYADNICFGRIEKASTANRRVLCRSRDIVVHPYPIIWKIFQEKLI